MPQDFFCIFGQKISAFRFPSGWTVEDPFAFCSVTAYHRGMNPSAPCGPLGALHLHSRFSFDGTLDHARLRALLLAHGVRFAGMTEHIEGLTPARVEESIAACRAHSDEEFLFLPGIEMDRFGVYFLGVVPGRGWEGAEAEAVFAELRRRARLMILAHPVKKGFCYPSEILAQCDGIELLNARHDGPFLPRPECMHLLETVRATRPGGVVALAGLDLHAAGDFRPVLMALEASTPLTEAAVLEALAGGAGRILRRGRLLEEHGPLERRWLGLRQQGMDWAHTLHRKAAQRGLVPPPFLKRRLRRLFEGG